jgi:hypothetical protein
LVHRVCTGNRKSTHGLRFKFVWLYMKKIDVFMR